MDCASPKILQGARERNPDLSCANKPRTSKRFGDLEATGCKHTAVVWLCSIILLGLGLTNRAHVSSMAAVAAAVPPYGHVITTEKWRNSKLTQSLKGDG